MQTYNNNTSFKLSPDVVYTLIDDEAVLMSFDGENLYGANPMAAKILQMLDEKPMTISLISQHILANYDIEETECLPDVQEMIAMLFSQGLITKVLG